MDVSFCFELTGILHQRKGESLPAFTMLNHLSRDDGDRLCFHGGMDVQCTPPFGTEDEVRRVARERIAVLGRDGGCILAPTHNVQVDTPAANIIARPAKSEAFAPGK